MLPCCVACLCHPHTACAGSEGEGRVQTIGFKRQKIKRCTQLSLCVCIPAPPATGNLEKVVRGGCRDSLRTHLLQEKIRRLDLQNTSVCTPLQCIATLATPPADGLLAGGDHDPHNPRPREACLPMYAPPPSSRVLTIACHPTDSEREIVSTPTTSEKGIMSTPTKPARKTANMNKQQVCYD